VKDHVCEWCGAKLVRGTNEAQGRFLARRFCGKSCSAKFSLTGKPSPKREESEERQCAYCGKTMIFDRSRHPNIAQWKVTKTCSIECGHKLAGRTKDHGRGRRQCSVCGRDYYRRDNQKWFDFKKMKTCGQLECIGQYRGDKRKGEYRAHVCVVCSEQVLPRNGESTWEFNRRLTCSKPCWHSLRGRSVSRTRLLIQPRKSEYPPEWTERLKDEIRERDGRICVLCGCGEGERAHQIHHVDYIKSHVHPTNLVTLCKSCHGKTNHNREFWQSFLTEFMLDRDNDIDA
jgi:hypothetical protein